MTGKVGERRIITLEDKHKPLAETMDRIHKVSKDVKPDNLAAVLNYIQFIANDALVAAGVTPTPYTVGSPPPPCPGCPPKKP